MSRPNRLDSSKNYPEKQRIENYVEDQQKGSSELVMKWKRIHAKDCSFQPLQEKKIAYWHKWGEKRT